MQDSDLIRYIRQMLCELAELADQRVESEELGALAYQMRLIAHRGEPKERTASPRKPH